uniref:Peptidase A1 domain-containing protein n=1 Tax=Rhabditophanes sp. KR3021 TaxID=114890 RepID=A0AC35U2J5_9BILA
MRLFLSSSGLILLLSCFCFLKVTAETTAKAVLSEPDDDEPSTQATLKELGAEEPDTAYGYPLSAFAVNCFPNITVPSGYKVLYGFGIPYLDDGNFYNVYTDQKNCPWAFREDGGLIQIMLDSHGLPVVYGPDGRLRAGFAIVKGLTRIARLTNKIFRGTFQNDLIQTQGHGLTEYPKFTKGPVVRCRHSRGIKSPDYLFGLDHPCNLAELDWAKASGSDAKITGGRGLTIASNRVMVPNIGVKISGSDKYYPVYITKIGKASTFDDQGVEIDVLIDFNGSPITVTVNGKINGGFKEVNGNLTLSITTGAKGEPIIDAALTLAEANPFNINNNLNFKTLGIDGYGFAINPMKDLPEPLRIGFSIGNYSLMMPPTFEEGYAMVPYLGVFPPNGPNKWTPVFADVKGSTWAFDETGAALQVLMDREKLPVVYNEQSRTYNGGFRAINVVLIACLVCQAYTLRGSLMRSGRYDEENFPKKFNLQGSGSFRRFSRFIPQNYDFYNYLHDVESQENVDNNNFQGESFQKFLKQKSSR